MADGWYSIAELHLMKLPGLPSSKASIIAKAARESWRFRARQGRGGGREYPASALPGVAQGEIAARSLRSLPASQALAVPSQRGVADLKHFQTRVMDARLGLIRQIELLTLFVGTEAKAIKLLLNIATTGQTPAGLPVQEAEEIRSLMARANARKGETRALVSRATLFNWLSAYRKSEGKIVAVAPAAPREFEIPAWADTLCRLYARPSKPNITECLEGWPKGEPNPSYDQARRFLKELAIQVRHAGRIGPRQLTQYKAFIRRDKSKLKPGAVFIGDGHTYKAEVAHPRHGRPFRPEITVILDIYTERWVGWSVALSENTWSVADALRHAVTTTTVPAVFYYDNGSGANNKVWDDPGLGIADRLAITKMNSAPWSSQARGIVERFNSSVLHKLARADDNYVGERMDKEARQRNFKRTRKDIREVGSSWRLTTWSDLMAEIRDAQAKYNARPHSSLPKTIDPETGKRRHQTPDEAWKGAIGEQFTEEPISPDEARLLFRPTMERTTARGEVRLFGNIYFAQELVPFHGCRVAVAFDIHDPARVSVSSPDGIVACEAMLDGNRRDYLPIAFVERAEQKRIEGMVKRAQAHVDKALAEGAPALIEQGFTPPVLNELEAAKQAKFEAEFEGVLISSPILDVEENKQAPAEIIPIETRATRFRRAIDIEKRIEAEESVSEADLRWFARYSRNPEFGTAKMMYEDFGEDALAE